MFVLGFSGHVSARETIFRLGGSVVIRADERIAGDVVAIGGTVDVLGDVVGDVVAIGGAVAVDGKVSGDVVAVGGEIILGPTALVDGDVTTVGGTVNRNPQAVVNGEISILTVMDSLRIDLFNFRWGSWQGYWSNWPVSLLYVAALFALALVVLAIIPGNVHAIEKHMETNAGRSAIIGLLTLVLLVPLTFVLVLTIIGAPLLWFGYFAAKMVGYVALVSIVGRKVTERFSPDSAPVWQLAVGVAIVAVLRFVPVFGALFTLVATVWSVGAVLDTKFGTNRPWLPPRQA